MKQKSTTKQQEILTVDLRDVRLRKWLSRTAEYQGIGASTLARMYIIDGLKRTMRHNLRTEKALRTQ